MTIESAKNIIVPLFLEKDVITIRDIYGSTLEGEASDHDGFIFELALDELSEAGMIKKLKNNLTSKEEAAWVLVKPLISLHQNIQIDGECAVIIAKTINAIIEKFSFDNLEEASPYNITQEDIEKLLLFLSEIKTQ